MVAICPTCKRPWRWKRSLPIDELAEVAPLTGQQRMLLEELVGAFPRHVSRDRLFDLLYQLDPNGGPDNISNSVAVRMSRIRQALRPFGWTLTSARGGVGNQGRYRLIQINKHGEAI